MLNKIFAAIRGQTDATTVDEAARLVERAHTEHAEAGRHLEAAQAAYQASLVADDDKAALAAYTDLERRKVLLDRAAAAIQLAEAGHADALFRAAEVVRERRYEAAKAKVAAALKKLDFYTEHALQIREIMKAVAEANVAVAAANADLPYDTSPLTPPERLARGAPKMPERVLRREALPDAWFYTGPQSMWGEVAAHQQAQVEKTGPNTGILQVRNQDSPMVTAYAVEKRSGGVKVTYVPERPGALPEALHTQIVLPGLRAGDPMLWTQTGTLNYLGEMGGDGPMVLAAVAAREAEPRKSAEELNPQGVSCERIEPATAPITAE